MTDSQASESLFAPRTWKGQLAPCRCGYGRYYPEFCKCWWLAARKKGRPS